MNTLLQKGIEFDHSKKGSNETFKMGLFAIKANMKALLIVSLYAVLVFQTKDTTKNKRNTLYWAMEDYLFMEDPSFCILNTEVQYRISIRTKTAGRLIQHLRPSWHV